jgi:ketosteroid isomerase-like protein
MMQVVTREQNIGLARAFLAAYWLGDLAGALAHCHPESVIDLARSLPILTPAPVSVVLPLMFREVFVKFKEERFDARIDSLIADERRVLVEYTARGTLIYGARPFACAYAVVFAMDDGMIARIRAYADARYVSAPFIDV